MLNRFRNAIYGTSAMTDDTASPEYDYVEAGSSKRVRSSLTRSSSFREDLLCDSGKSRGKSTNSYILSRGKSQFFKGTSSHSEDTDSQYSYSANGTYDNKPNHKITKLPKFRYSRPEFLQLKTDDEILVSADHQIRPIILPRDVSRLPWKSGYAECINAGKSIRNEDQAACYQDVLVKKSSSQPFTSESISIENTLPWVYFGIFDGHAGSAVAVAAATQLHNIISEKLRNIVDLLIALEFNKEDEEYQNRQTDSSEEKNCEKPNGDIVENKKLENNNNNLRTTPTDESCDKTESISDEPKDQVNLASNDIDEPEPKKNKDEICKQQVQSNTKELPESCLLSMIDICENNITVDSLIIGTLESAFWEMDLLIAQDKLEYKMAGGCTAIVSLFILGKLYVCNAGDSRATVYKNDKVIPMSFDFTPISERDRILKLGMQRPEFLGNEFTHLEFIKRPTRDDIGKQMLYKDAYMTGWSVKSITPDDLKFPLVWGEGKRSRVLATIGVTRGFGDHELRAQYGNVLIKPFLTPEPEVKILPLEHDDTLEAEDVLIMGTDGLWDVTSNEEAADIVKNSFNLFPDNEESRYKYRYMTAAQDLVIHSRGHTTNWNNLWRTHDLRLASLDDIAVFVIPLKQYKDEYIEWKKLRAQSKLKASSHRHLEVEQEIS